jgi:putative membrane protein
MLFLWMKAFHLISLISWFAGLFYLPRLFVYYAENSDSRVRETLLTMQKKLWKIIMVPASTLTALFGFVLIDLTREATLFTLWFQIKLFLLFILYAYHFYLRGVVKRFERGTPPQSGRFYRILNEIPTLIMILIVILVVIKPWR